MTVGGFVISNINQKVVRAQLRDNASLIAGMVSTEIDFFANTVEKNLEQIKTLYSSINSIMSNAGMTTPSYDNISRSRSIGDISITTGGITITGNADNSTLGNIKDMLDAQAKEIYKNIAKQLS